VVAVVLSGCRGAEEPPAAELAAAFRATLAGSFAFEVALDADAAALPGLGADAAAAASTLRGIGLRGVVDGEDTQLELLALGGAVVEVRQVADVLYLRAGIVDLLAGVGIATFDSEQELLDGLAGTGVPAGVLEAVETVYDGGWIGLEGGLAGVDLAGIGTANGDNVDASASPAATAGALLAALGTNLDGFFDRFVEVAGVDESTGDEAFLVELRLRDLLRVSAEVGRDVGLGAAVGLDGLEEDLAALPATVPARVTVARGVVTGLVFDVAAAARQAGLPVEGEMVLRLMVADHGVAGPVGTPGGVVLVGADDVAATLAVLTASR